MTYVIPDPLPRTALASPLAAAEDSVARLDERLGASLIREGWISRTPVMDACASLGLQGAPAHPRRPCPARRRHGPARPPPRPHARARRAPDAAQHRPG